MGNEEEYGNPGYNKNSNNGFLVLSKPISLESNKGNSEDIPQINLDKNNIISNYSFELIPEEISNLFIKFSFIKDNSKYNYNNAMH